MRATSGAAHLRVRRTTAITAAVNVLIGAVFVSGGISTFIKCDGS